MKGMVICHEPVRFSCIAPRAYRYASLRSPLRSATTRRGSSPGVLSSPPPLNPSLLPLCASASRCTLVLYWRNRKYLAAPMGVWHGALRAHALEGMVMGPLPRQNRHVGYTSRLQDRGTAPETSPASPAGTPGPLTRQEVVLGPQCEGPVGQEVWVGPTGEGWVFASRRSAANASTTLEGTYRRA